MGSDGFTLVVLSAGIGSRYNGLKQLVEVGPSGEKILDYSIYDAIKAGFSKIIFIIRKDIRFEFKEAIGNKFEEKIKIFYVYQELDDLPKGYTIPKGRIKPWGTGHALLSIYKKIKEPFLVINADDFYGRDSYKIAALHLSGLLVDDIAISLVGFKLKNTLSDFGSVSRGICKVNRSKYLTEVKEVIDIRKSAKGIESSASFHITGNEIVSMNMWITTPVVLESLRKLFVKFLEDNILINNSEFFLPSAINTIIKSEGIRVPVKESQNIWFGLTYKDDKTNVVEKIKTLVKAGEYPMDLWRE